MNTGIILHHYIENVLSFNLTPWSRKSDQGKRRNSSFRLTVFRGSGKANPFNAKLENYARNTQLICIFTIMNFSASSDPIFLIKVSIWSSDNSQYNGVKLFLYSSYFLLKIAALKTCTFSFPWPLDLRWAALDSNYSAFCSWESKLSNKPWLVAMRSKLTARELFQSIQNWGGGKIYVLDNLECICTCIHVYTM